MIHTRLTALSSYVTDSNLLSTYCMLSLELCCKERVGSALMKPSIWVKQTQSPYNGDRTSSTDRVSFASYRA